MPKWSGRTINAFYRIFHLRWIARIIKERMSLCLKLFSTAFLGWMSEQLSRNLEENKRKSPVAPNNFRFPANWKRVIKKMSWHPCPACVGSQL